MESRPDLEKVVVYLNYDLSFKEIKFYHCKNDLVTSCFGWSRLSCLGGIPHPIYRRISHYSVLLSVGIDGPSIWILTLNMGVPKMEFLTSGMGLAYS